MESLRRILPLGILALMYLFSSSHGQTDDATFLFNYQDPTGYTMGCVESDWVMRGAYCYKLFDSASSWSGAQSVCASNKAWLPKITDHLQNEFLGSEFVSGGGNSSFWIGLHGDGSAFTWADGTSAGSTIGLWGPYQPTTGYSGCVAAKGWYENDPVFGTYPWSVEPCSSQNWFFCQTQACPANSFQCGDGSCISLDNVCDGKTHCTDESDETVFDNTACAAVTHLSGSSGSLSYPDGVTGQARTWVIESTEGSILRIKFTSFESEVYMDYLDVYTGAGSTEAGLYVATFSGDMTADMPLNITSTNNLATLYLSWTVGSTPPQFELEWCEVTLPGGVGGTGTIQSVSGEQCFTADMGGTWVFEAAYKQEWVTITMTISEYSFSSGDVLTIYDGDTDTGFVLARFDGSLPSYGVDAKDVITTTGHYAYVEFEALSGSASTTFTLCHNQGCDVYVNTDSGTICSPGYDGVNDYGINLLCRYVIEATPPILLSMTSFDINDASTDHVMVYDGIEEDGIVLGTFDGSAIPTIPIAQSNTLTVIFRSDSNRTGLGFCADFEIGCPNPSYDNNTLIDGHPGSPVPLQFGATFNVSCGTGYVFNQEKYSTCGSGTSPEVTYTLECLSGGQWNYGSDVSLLPRCSGIYCGLPPSVANGLIVDVSSVVYGGNATYECRPGFNILPNPGVATCDENGQWVDIPTCSSANCTALIAPVNGSINITHGSGVDFGSVVTFACDPGFYLEGEPVMYCENGSWSGAINQVCLPTLCSLPYTTNGNWSVAGSWVEYGDSVTLQCDSGYIETGATTFTCDSIGTESDPFLSGFSPQPVSACVDEDQCPTAPCTHNCTDYIGYYECSCLTGYLLNADGFTCDDIDECNGTLYYGLYAEPPPCLNTASCTNTDASYSCSVTGFDVFTDVSRLYGAETGFDTWNQLQINVTRQVSSCGVAPDPGVGGVWVNGHDPVEEGTSMQLYCDLGSMLSHANNTVLCDSSGNFVAIPDVPSCIPVTCNTSDLDTTGLLNPATFTPGLVVNFGENVTLMCGAATRYRYCALDNATQTGILVGDNLECGVVDCGFPSLGLGENISSWTVGNENDTAHPAAFEFTCEEGYTLTGSSGLGNTTVTCMMDGCWDFNDLRCTGIACTDPGTYAGTNQSVGANGYQDGETISFVCLDDGDVLTDSSTWTCLGGNWSQTDPPLCQLPVGMPTITCDPTTVTFERYEYLNLSYPEARDSNGLLITDFYSDPPLGEPLFGDVTVTWTATDSMGVSVTCNVSVTVTDPTSDVPYFFFCYNTTGDENSKTFYLTDALVVTSDSEDAILISGFDFGAPSATTQDILSIDVIEDNLYEGTVVGVTIDGSNVTCPFRYTILPGPCQEFSVRKPLDATKTCTDTGDDGKSCDLTCDSGFTFAGEGGSTSLTYNCTLAGGWTSDSVNGYQDFVPDCVESIPETYYQYFNMTYNVSGANFSISECDISEGSALATALKVKLVDDTEFNKSCSFLGPNTIPTIFDAIPVEVLSDNTVVVELRIEHGSGHGDYSNCANNLVANMGASTIYNGGILDVTVSGVACSGMNFVFLADSDQLADAFMGCRPGQIHVSTSCEHCGLGMYNNGTACVPCDIGSYQEDPVGSDSCTVCPGGTNTFFIGRTSSSDCIVDCEPGWYRENLICVPCPPDTYGGGSDGSCTMCPDGSTTNDIPGNSDISQCIGNCTVGHWSASGTQPCSPCPYGTYSDSTSTECLECPDGQSTIGENSTVGDCAADVCDTRDPCINGNCTITGITTTCVCLDGYYGTFCELAAASVDLCSSSPCYNGGTCMSNATDYTCECAGGTSAEFTETVGSRVTTAAMSSTATGTMDLEAAKTSCLSYCSANGCACFAIGNDGSNNLHCNIYSQAQCDGDTVASTSPDDILYDPDPTIVAFFGGDRCEIDLIDACDSSPCQNDGMCQDTLDGYICHCRTDGPLFTGLNCTEGATACAADPCANPDATCVDISASRRKCQCPPGYTGAECDQAVDDCSWGPCLNGGNCTDELDGFTCGCLNGFSGTYCELFNDFCLENDPCGGNGTCINDYDNMVAMCSCNEGYGDAYTSTFRITGNGTKDLTYQTFVRDGESVVCESGRPVNIECYTETGSNPWEEIGEVIRIPCLIAQGFLCDANDQDDGQCDGYRVRWHCPDYYQPSCPPIDPCALANPCHYGGTCMYDSPGQFSCACATGYTGFQCQQPISYCASQPCQNGGTCTNFLDGYNCTCLPGTEGTDCEIITDLCYNCVNHVDCTPTLNDYTCNCSVGWIGKNCSEQIDSCMSGPCINGGNCTDLYPGFSCACPDGWSGDHCESMDDTCSPVDPCVTGDCIGILQDNRCRCPAGTFGDLCDDIPDVCVNSNPCINGGNCSSGADPICTCNLWTGDGCECALDFCSGEPCQNGGICNANPDGANYSCTCIGPYTGVNCETEIDYCSDPTAPTCTNGECYNIDDTAVCVCDLGYSGTDCSIDTEYDMDIHLCGDRTTTSAYPVNIGDNAVAFTLGAWIRFDEAGSTGSPVCLLDASTGDRIACLTHEGGMASLTTTASIMSSSPINDGEWHYLSIGRDESYELVLTNGLVLNDEDDYDIGIYLPEELLVELGADGFVGSVSQVRVWDRLLVDDDRIYLENSKQQVDLTEPFFDGLISDFGGFPLGGCAQRVDGAISTDDDDDEVAGVTTTTCPADFKIYDSERLATLTWTEPTFQDEDGDEVGSTCNYASGPGYMPGIYEVLCIGEDDVGSIGQCIFDAAVMYESCEEPQAVQENTQVVCSGSADLYMTCEVICEPGKAIHQPVPDYFTCGQSGFWNPHAPEQLFCLPMCGDIVDDNAALVWGWHHVWPTMFDEATRTTLLEAIAYAIQQLDESLDAPGICNANCSNHEVSIPDSALSSSPGSTVPIVVRSTDLPDTVTYTSPSYSATAQAAIIQMANVDRRLIFDDEDEDNYDIIGTRDFSSFNFYIRREIECIAPAMNVNDEYCVECTPGSFYNTSTETCELCPWGYYQDQAGAYNCTACPPLTINMCRPAINESYCKEICQPGHYYNATLDDCLECGQGYYQPLEAQNMCLMCDPGYTTAITNATNITDCFLDCPAGEELASVGPGVEDCIPCEIASYRNKSEGLYCMDCPYRYINGTRYDFTTASNGTVSSDLCNIILCEPGYYRVGVDPGECVECPLGSYRGINDTDMETCLNCSAIFGEYYTTLQPASDSQDDCQLFCLAGFYLYNDTCEACPLDTYKTDEYPFATNCTPCPSSLPNTLDVNSTSNASCYYGGCTAGQIVNVNYDGIDLSIEPCINCSIGFYQNVSNPIPYDPANCTVCPVLSTTLDVGSADLSECIEYCPDGQQKNSSTDECEDCPVGYYKDNSVSPDAMWENCTKCPDGFLTETTGATSVDNCTVVDCSQAGRYRDSVTADCFLCPIGTWQDTGDQPSCNNCTEGYTTNTTGSTSEDDCIRYCEEGYELNATRDGCVICEVGYYRSEDDGRFGPCVQCPDSNYTTANPGSTSAADCNVEICPPGEYAVNGECSDCPVGTFQPSRGTTVCIDCPRPNTTANTRSAHADDCNVFDGRSASIIITLQLEWNAALEDRDSSDFNALRALVFTQVIAAWQAAGLPVNNFLVQLILAMFRSGDRPGSVVVNLRVDYDHTQGPNGTIITEQMLEDALQAFFDSVNGSLVLANGTVVSVADLGTEVECRNGTYYDHVSLRCEDCPVGQYQLLTDFDNCRTCPDNSTTDGPGAFGTDICKRICPVGEEPVDETTCQLCPLHSYKDTEGIELCTNCTEGYETSDVGSTSEDSCMQVCDPGEYSDMGLCEECPRNTYNSDRFATSCTHCEGGYVTASTGAVYEDECLYPCTPSLGYCLNGGQCKWSTALEMPECICEEPYHGDRCQIRGGFDSNSEELIIGIVCGLGGLLLACLAIVGICIACRRQFRGPRRKPLPEPTPSEYSAEYRYMYQPVGVAPMVTYPVNPVTVNPMMPQSMSSQFKIYDEAPSQRNDNPYYGRSIFQAQ